MMPDDAEPPPLRPDELIRVREMFKSEDRAVWFWGTVKVWATWIAAVVLGVSMGWDALKKIVQALR